MAVVIPESAGYEGTVNEPQWSDLLAMSGGRQYGVGGPGDWVASIGGADREVRLSPGRGFGYGVRDKTTADASIVLPASTSGSVWHLICVHRDWQANQSRFDSVAGTSARALPTRDASPGQVDDQPLWLARVDAGKSQVQQLVDLRVWGGDGGSFAVDDLVLQYINRVGTVIRVGRMSWARVLNAQSIPTWVRSDDGTPVGSIQAFAGANAPDGWLMCDGRTLERSAYADLFAVLGTAFGAPSPTTFNLPNMGGRVAVGLNGESEFNARGKTGGEKTQKLSVDQMPSHGHYLDGPIGGQLSGTNGAGSGGSGAGYAPWFGGGFGAQPARVNPAGGNQPHNNLQPYIALPHIIKAQ